MNNVFATKPCNSCKYWYWDGSPPQGLSEHGGAMMVSGKQGIEAAAGAPPRGRRHQSQEEDLHVQEKYFFQSK